MLQALKSRMTATVTWLIILIWTFIVGGSLFWTLHNDRQEIMNMAYAEARANLNKDITFRRWATEHGGVYVPITDKQKSIPWLSHVPGRDVITADGRELTLLNPATMVRQMMDRYARDYGVRGRITGLKYLNPGNAPDPWEKRQLEAFDRGERNEVWEVADIDQQPHLRYLRAMFMEPGCDKCHAILGYKLGDMRGATGLNLPLTPFYQRIEAAQLNFGLTHGGIWLFGLAGILLSSGMVHRREQALRQSKAIIDSSEVAIIGKDLNGNITSWNLGAEILFGYSAGEIIGESALRLIPGNRHLEEAEVLKRIAQGQKVEPCNTVRQCKDGRMIDIAMSVSPILDSHGKVVGVSKIARDITARKQTDEALKASLKEKTALLNEVHHRVKNNLQVVASLLRLESGRSDSANTRDVLNDMQTRIHSMALLHEMIYRSGTFAATDLGGYIRQIANQLFHSLQATPGAIALRLELTSVQVGLDLATPCGLLVSELLSNCLKHGFPDGRSGEICIELKPVDDDQHWLLRVSDTGVGLPADFEARRRTALGLQLISGLALQLGTTLEIGPRPQAVFAVTFKIDKPAPLVMPV